MHPQQPPTQPYGQQAPHQPAHSGQQAKVNHAIPARVLLLIGTMAAAYAAAGTAFTAMIGGDGTAVAAACLIAFMLGLVSVGMAGFNTSARYVVIVFAVLAFIVGVVAHLLAPDLDVSYLLAMIVGVLTFGIAMALLPKRPIP